MSSSPGEHHPQAVYMNNLLRERGGDLTYGDISTSFLSFSQQTDPAATRTVEEIGILLHYHGEKRSAGEAVTFDRERLFGPRGLVHTFRIFCALEYLVRLGIIETDVTSTTVLDSLDNPPGKIHVQLTDRGHKLGNSLLWRQRLSGSVN